MLPAIELKVRAHFDELSALAEKITDFLEAHSVGPEGIFAANLAVEELVTNIVKYGYDDQLEHTILIRLEVESTALKIEIEDTGHEFNPFTLPEPDTSRAVEERGIGGLGIHFVRNLLDECSYERIDGLNRVTLRKRLTT